MSDSSVAPWTVVWQVPLSVGFPGQEHWSGLQLPSPGDLPDPGIEPPSPALAGRFFTAEPPGKPFTMRIDMQISDALKSKNSFTQFRHLFWGDNPLVLAYPPGIRDGYLYLKYICLYFWPCCLIEKWFITADWQWQILWRCRGLLPDELKDGFWAWIIFPHVNRKTRKMMNHLPPPLSAELQTT